MRNIKISKVLWPYGPDRFGAVQGRRAHWRRHPGRVRHGLVVLSLKPGNLCRITIFGFLFLSPRTGKVGRLPEGLYLVLPMIHPEANLPSEHDAPGISPAIVSSSPHTVMVKENSENAQDKMVRRGPGSPAKRDCVSPGAKHFQNTRPGRVLRRPCADAGHRFSNAAWQVRAVRVHPGRPGFLCTGREAATE